MFSKGLHFICRVLGQKYKLYYDYFTDYTLSRKFCIHLISSSLEENFVIFPHSVVFNIELGNVRMK